jgi:hypothetical protein
MSEPEKTQQSLPDELRDLGKNLEALMRGLWESEERKQLQENLQSSFYEVRDTIERAAEDVTESETGRRIREDVIDIQRRIETGEVETKARQEALKVLKHINQELEKTINRWSEDKPVDEDIPVD